MTTGEFRRTVWNFYQEHGRHELPWRVNLDPYAILVSEVMLQQTQVERVVPKFEAWLTAFPNFKTLAAAPLPQVFKLWQGLGYNRRALALQRCAHHVMGEYNGQLSNDEAELLRLPGIGPYTARAIQAFAFNMPVVMIETNIRAVYIHHFFTPLPQPLSLPRRGEKRGEVPDSELLLLIEKTLDRQRPREWYWALMDYGAYIKKQYPNPNRRSRTYVRQSRFVGSRRQVRGAVIRALTQQPALSEKKLRAQLLRDGVAIAELPSILERMAQEGFLVRQSARHIRLTTTVSKSRP